MNKLCIILLLLAIPLFAQDANNSIILKNINALRISKSLDTLQYDKRLKVYAKKWSKYIVDKLSTYPEDSIRQYHKNDPSFLHVDFNPRFDKALKVREILSIGENMNLTVEENFELVNYALYAFNCWEKSKLHYELIIDKDSNKCAFDYFYDKKTKRLLCLLVLAEIKK